jgi:hypothetical protein
MIHVEQEEDHSLDSSDDNYWPSMDEEDDEMKPAAQADNLEDNFISDKASDNSISDKASNSTGAANVVMMVNCGLSNGPTMTRFILLLGDLLLSTHWMLHDRDEDLESQQAGPSRLLPMD